jgi:hypothetical protein
MERNSGPGTFFNCPECNRKYERTGAKGAAAEQLLKELLAPRGGARPPIRFMPTRRRKQTDRQK